MGMYDKETNLTASDYGDGREFALLSAQFIGIVSSQEFGSRPEARVTVADNENGEPRTFKVYGVLADQVSRAESGEIPAIVRIAQDGRANTFEFVRAL